MDTVWMKVGEIKGGKIDGSHITKSSDDIIRKVNVTM